MRIYFMGICGTAMGNGALLARAAGHDVEGADSGVYPPMSDVLATAGIRVQDGYDAKRLASSAPDLVVIGNALSRGNPEVEWLLESRVLPYTSLAAFLYESVLKSRRNVVVAGTHGKTTTTALTAYLLRSLGRDPGFLIGGVPVDPPTGNHLGTAADPFVIEGDEYDTAFFDKRSKFIHYAPNVAVLNNLEFDHADIFRDLADVQRTFGHFVRLVPRNGWIVLNGDDDNIRALGPMPWTRVVRVGTGAGNDVRIEGFSESATGARFELRWKRQTFGAVSWSLPGIFNARNAAMAATAAQLALLSAGEGIETVEDSLKTGAGNRVDLGALANFRGVKRRQEILLSSQTLTVIEDFGHHPTALAETLQSFRSRFPGAILTAVFEPRSNTARTRSLQAGFTRALAIADEVYLGAVNRAEKLRAEERFDPEAVAGNLEAQGIDAYQAPSNAILLETLLRNTSKAGERPRVVAFFTNGSFDGIIAEYVTSVKS